MNMQFKVILLVSIKKTCTQAYNPSWLCGRVLLHHGSAFAGNVGIQNRGHKSAYQGA